MKFSVIIPTYKAGSQLDYLLKALFECKGFEFEIIVIDSNSGENVLEICNRYGAKLMSIDKKSFDHGGTRNLGASKSTGEILMFITQDIVPFDTNLLKAFSKVFEDPNIGGAFAHQLPRIGSNPVEALSRKYSYPDVSRINTYKDFVEKGISALYFANPCACVRRDVFEKVGGFPDRIIGSEDVIIAHKILSAGYKTAYAADALVYHSHNYSPVQLINRYFDIGVSYKSHPELNSKAKNAGEGIKQVKLSLLSLLRNKQYKWIPKFFIETVSKVIGYNLGKQYKRIPNLIRIQLSMNKNFWK